MIYLGQVENEDILNTMMYRIIIQADFFLTKAKSNESI